MWPDAFPPCVSTYLTLKCLGSIISCESVELHRSSQFNKSFFFLKLPPWIIMHYVNFLQYSRHKNCTSEGKNNWMSRIKNSNTIRCDTVSLRNMWKWNINVWTRAERRLNLFKHQRQKLKSNFPTFTLLYFLLLSRRHLSVSHYGLVFLLNRDTFANHLWIYFHYFEWLVEYEVFSVELKFLSTVGLVLLRFIWSSV